MNDTTQLETEAKELIQTAKDMMAKADQINETIKEMREDKPWSFIEWYRKKVSDFNFNIGNYPQEILTQFGGAYYASKKECIQDNERRMAGYIIRETFKRIVGDWKPDWSDPNQRKYCFYYNNNEDEISISATYIHQGFPDWFYISQCSQNECEKAVNGMKELYGTDIMKYYLTGRK